MLVAFFLFPLEKNAFGQAYTITWQGLTGNTNAQNVPAGITVVTQYNGVTGGCVTTANGATTSYSAVIRAAAGFNFTITSIGGSAYASSAGSKDFTIQLVNGGNTYTSATTRIETSSSCGGTAALTALSVPAAGQTVTTGNQVTITVLRAAGGATGGGYSWTRTLTVSGVVSPACSNGTISLTTGNNIQTANQGSAIAAIRYSVGGGATNASVTGLPPGVTGSLAAGVFSISGTPTASGSYPYTVTATGGCSNVTAAGNITVNAAPTVSTTTVSSITTTAAGSGGNVTSDGGSIVTARGIVYGTAVNPTVAGSKTTDGAGLGIFTSNISGLQPNTQYFYRGYATNAVNTSYGSESSFFTLADQPLAPVVNAATATSLNVTIATGTNPVSTTYAIRSGINNYVQANGTLGAVPVWQTALVWGTKTVTGLIPSTPYIFTVNARNTNNIESGFGSTATKATLANIPGMPLVNAATASTLNVTIIPNGNSDFTEYAIYEATTGNFIQADGSFSGTPVWQIADLWGTRTVIDLASSTQYSFQVSARNPDLIKTALSDATDASTLGIGTPFLSATAIPSFGSICLGQTSAVTVFTLSGSNLEAGDIVVAATNGYSYSTTETGPFSSTLTLNQQGGDFSQEVYVVFSPVTEQSYNGHLVAGGSGADNIDITVSGEGINTKPSLSITQVNAIGIDAATLQANITVTGCSEVTAYGIEYSTVAGFANGTGVSASATNLNNDNFSVSLTGLDNSTHYYVHAYAINAGGTAYSNEADFTTLTPLLTASTLTGFGNICLNTTTNASTCTITGTNLSTEAISITALNGYSFSVDDIQYSSTLSISQPGGNFSQTVYVKFNPVLAQSYAGMIQVNGGGSNTTIAVSGTGINTPATVVTGSSSGILQVSATIHGTVSSIGCSEVSAYGIEYSITNGFANGAGINAPGNNLSGNVFSVVLNSLSANTVYYYKAYATNNGGKIYGSQQQFTTSSLVTPVAIAASSVLSNSFVANWNAVAGATNYRLDVSTSPTFTGTTNAADLFFSEYIEGSGNNKYLEIYNGTGTTVDLSNYKLRLYSNGGTTATFDVQLAGNLPTGSTVVLKNGSATLYSGAATVNSAVNWNGDDAFDLFKISSNSVVDIFGRIGEDPGTAWASGSLSTLDKTLVRKGSVSGGVTSNPASGFPTLATEWDVFNTDDVSHLGSHVYNGNGPSFVPGYDNLTVNGTSQLVSGLAVNTTYYYRVRAFSSNSTSGNSNTISVQTCSLIPTISGNLSFCEGGTTILGSLAAATYQWNFNGAPIDGATNQTLNVSEAGNYTVTVRSAAGCTGTSAITTVTVISLPSTAVLNITQPSCSIATGSVTVSSPPGADLTYSIGNGFQAGPVFNLLLPGNYNVVVKNNAGCESMFPAQAIINPQPSAAGQVTVTGIVNICPYINSGAVLTYKASASGASSYNWALPPNVTLVAGGTPTDSVSLLFNTPFNSLQPNKQIRVTANSVCGNSAQVIYYLEARVPVTPTPIVGPTSVCDLIGTTNTATYTISPTLSSLSYQWTLPPHATATHPEGEGSINDTIILVSFDALFTGGDIGVVALNGCGLSGTRTIHVSFAPAATPGLINGPTNVCAHIAPTGIAATYSVAPVETATGYTWTAPPGATIIPAGPGVDGNTVTILYPAGFIAGTIGVTATNGCGISTLARTLTVNKLNPATPSNIDVIQTHFCGDPGFSRTFTYTVSSLQAGAASIQWTVPTTAGAILVSGQGTTSIMVTYPDASVTGTVTAQSVNACAVSSIRSIPVKLPACPPPAFARNENQHAAKPASKSIEGNVMLQAEKLSIRLFPNPATSESRLEIISPLKDKVAVYVRDAQGRIVKEFSTIPNQVSMIGADLRPGIYIVEVRQEDLIKTMKLIKF